MASDFSFYVGYTLSYNSCYFVVLRLFTYIRHLRIALLYIFTGTSWRIMAHPLGTQEETLYILELSSLTLATKTNGPGSEAMQGPADSKGECVRAAERLGCEQQQQEQQQQQFDLRFSDPLLVFLTRKTNFSVIS